MSDAKQKNISPPLVMRIVDSRKSIIIMQTA